MLFDALRVKIHAEGLVRNKAVYLAIGMRCSGHKDILGLWIEQTERAKFWLRVMNELRSRGLNDVLIAGVDGLKGSPEAIKPIYQADNVEAAEQALSEFEQGEWGQLFPTVAQSWRRHWEQVIPFFAFAPEVRKMIYTTNAIERLHSQVRKSIRNKGHFPSDEAATKLIWLALRYITAKWKNPPIAWHKAMAQFAIQFGERFTLYD